MINSRKFQLPAGSLGDEAGRANLIAANLIAANLIAANLIAANLIAANLIAKTAK
jgi:uncharacterized protein YjbI with pentapeptide repeats